MFYGISWLVYIRMISLVALGYYLVIAWIYRKELLACWKELKNRVK